MTVYSFQPPSLAHTVCTDNVRLNAHVLYNRIAHGEVRSEVVQLLQVRVTKGR